MIKILGCIVTLLVVCMTTVYGQYYSSVLENVTLKSGKVIPTLKKLPKNLRCPAVHTNKEYWDSIRTLPITITEYYKKYNVIEGAYSNGQMELPTNKFFFLGKDIDIKKFSPEPNISYIFSYCIVHNVLYSAIETSNRYEDVDRKFWDNMRVLPIEVTSIDEKERTIYWIYKDDFLIELGSFYIPEGFKPALGYGKFIDFKDIKRTKYLATYLKSDMILYGLDEY